MAKKKTSQYKVEVLSGCYIDGVYYQVGKKVKVSQDFHRRVVAERNNKLKAL